MRCTVATGRGGAHVARTIRPARLLVAVEMAYLAPPMSYQVAWQRWAPTL